MLSRQFQSFCETAQKYNELYKIFTRGEGPQNKIWIHEKLMPILIPKLNLVKDSHKFKVLSVGAGNGSFDLLLINALLKEIKSHFPGTTASWTVVEPNSVAVQDFQRKVQSDEDYCTNISFVWEIETFQDFISKQRRVKEAQKYHLITFIHSLYYVDERLALRQSYNLLLEDQGMILAVKEKEKSTTLEAFRMYVQLMGQTPRDFTLSEEILLELQLELGMAYDRFTVPISVDITEMFHDDDPVGGALVNFLLHTSDDPRKSEEGIKMLEFLKSKSWSVLKGEEEIFLVNMDIDVTAITKSV
ncbi:histamine N-methyltransferase-like [Rhopilema esculentum]|uniref:histamine N-methyltransferase-like n=1 Tax=Rhopilema esculentum TaxID=499914 RepID=UPI0031D9E59B|eukprot:gene10302-19000_t